MTPRRSEAGAEHSQLEYDHSSNSELELLGDSTDQDSDTDLFTFNNAELYITDPEDSADYQQFEFEV